MLSIELNILNMMSDTKYHIALQLLSFFILFHNWKLTISVKNVTEKGKF